MAIIINSSLTGKWSDEELKLLSDAVHELTNTKRGESVTTGINWREVSERVKTRHERQCLEKWFVQFFIYKLRIFDIR